MAYIPPEVMTLGSDWGRGHDWEDVPPGELPERIELSAWPRYERAYSRGTSKNAAYLPSAARHCLRCGILAPSSGVRPEDRDCDRTVVSAVMES
jgi:hypothetical protein